MQIELDLAWLAGFLDSKRVFSIRTFKRMTKSGKRKQFQPQLAITTSEDSAIYKIKKILNFCRIDYTERLKGQQNEITVYSKGLRKIIPLIDKYSIDSRTMNLIKKALELAQKQQGNKGKIGRASLSSDKIKEITKLSDELREKPKIKTAVS